MTTMPCIEARELVSDYIDGELPEATAAALEDHLETCPNCPPLYASLIQTLSDLKALAEAAPIDDFDQRMAAALANADAPGDATQGTDTTGDPHG